jgi:hypothetical protein
MWSAGANPDQPMPTAAILPMQSAIALPIFGQQSPIMTNSPCCATGLVPVPALGVHGINLGLQTHSGACTPARVLTAAGSSPETLAVPPAKRSKTGLLSAGGVSLKKDEKERAYSEAQFQSMLCAVLRGRSARRVADDANFPGARCTLQRYARDIRNNPSLERWDEAETLEAQLQFAATVTLKQKGNFELTARRIFSEDELDFFAAQLKMYAEMGWPYRRAACECRSSGASSRASRVRARSV